VIADKCMCKRLDHHGLVQEGYRSTWERVLFGQHRLIDFLRSAKKADGLDGRLDRLTCFVLLITHGVGFDLVETNPTVFPDHDLPCRGVRMDRSIDSGQYLPVASATDRRCLCRSIGWDKNEDWRDCVVHS
jgi:hypothetical protein